MAQANQPESNNAFVSRQALAPTPQLYDELVGDKMENLANISINELTLIDKGSVILDDGCGTGAGTAAVIKSMSSDVLSTLNPEASTVMQLSWKSTSEMLPRINGLLKLSWQMLKILPLSPLTPPLLTSSALPSCLSSERMVFQP
jgi:hypothetical protein